MKDELNWKNQEKILYSAEPDEDYEEQPRCLISRPFDDLFAEEMLPVIGDFFIDEDEKVLDSKR